MLWLRAPGGAWSAVKQLASAAAGEAAHLAHEAGHMAHEAMRAAQAAAAAKQEERPGRLGGARLGPGDGRTKSRRRGEPLPRRAKEALIRSFFQGTGGSRQHYRIAPWLKDA